VLKTFGATRARLLAAYGLEYLGIAAVTALFGVAIGTLAAALIVTRLMEFPFVFVAGAAAAAAAAAVAVTLALGLAGTFAALGRKPAEVLRNL
jgi:putative ABC transport system permease protein